MYGCKNGYIFAFGFKYVRFTIIVWRQKVNLLSF
jgi:hypothetical protein